MADTGNILAAVAAIVAAGIAAWATRRGAKESGSRTDAVTAAGLYMSLTSGQRDEIDRLVAEVEALRPLRDEVDDLRRTVRHMVDLATTHIKWDELWVAEVNKANVPGLHLTEPPPLIEEDLK